MKNSSAVRMGMISENKPHVFFFLCYKLFSACVKVLNLLRPILYWTHRIVEKKQVKLIKVMFVCSSLTILDDIC